MPKNMNTFSSYLDPQRVPMSQAERDRERQYPDQFASLARAAVEKSRLRTHLSPAAGQVSNEGFVDKIRVQCESLDICQKEEGHYH